MIGQFSFFCAGKEMQRPLIGLRIFGTQGMIYLEERDAGTVNIAYNDGRSEQIPYEPQAGYREELLNFYNHLVHGEPLESTPEIEFGDTHAMLAILRSAQDGQPITVEARTGVGPDVTETLAAAVAAKTRPPANCAFLPSRKEIHYKTRSIQ